MLSRSVWPVIVILALFGGIARAEVTAQIDDYVPFTDAQVDSGQLARPRICPADTSWVAYEVRHKETVQLFIYNLVTRDKRLLNPSETADEFGNNSHRKIVCKDLAWCPRKTAGGKIWAAFVSDAISGNPDLFLYDVSAAAYYQLKPAGASGSQRVSEPAWSPDGTCLTYTASMADNSDIYIIRGMDWVLRNPADETVAGMHEPLVSGSGNQSGGIWCPVPYSGYLAFTDQGKKNGKFSIKVYDPLTMRTFSLTRPDPDLDYFAPAWNDAGLRLAYFTNQGMTIKNGELTGDKYGLGIAGVKLFRDSLILDPKRGGARNTEKVIDIAPNDTRFQPPAWLPGGRGLIIPLYDETKNNPLRVVSLADWEIGSQAQEWWLSPVPVKGMSLNFVREISITNKQMAFVYAGGEKQYAAVGWLADGEDLDVPAQYLDVGKSRETWYKGWVKSPYEKPGVVKGVWNLLKSPVAGKDLFFNRPIITAATVGLVIALTTGGNGGGGGTVDSTRDWRLPINPNPPQNKSKTWFGIRLRF